MAHFSTPKKMCLTMCFSFPSKPYFFLQKTRFSIKACFLPTLVVIIDVLDLWTLICLGHSREWKSGRCGLSEGEVTP